MPSTHSLQVIDYPFHITCISHPRLYPCPMHPVLQSTLLPFHIFTFTPSTLLNVRRDALATLFLISLCLVARSARTRANQQLFPGLIYRMMKPKVVLLIFVSGKIVLTGAKVREEIYMAFNQIYSVLVGTSLGSFPFPLRLRLPLMICNLYQSWIWG